MGCLLTVMEQLNRSNCPEERKTSGELPGLKEEKTPELNILETDVRTKRGIFRTKQMKASNIGTRGRARSFSLETHTHKPVNNKASMASFIAHSWCAAVKGISVYFTVNEN